MIIDSLLDTDLYKFTMMQAVLHQFPSAHVKYEFKCRDESLDLRPLAARIQQEINGLCQLRFKHDELDYLRQFSFFKDDFIEFLGIFQLNSKYVNVSCDDKLAISIEGSWLHTIMFEVPLLAIISECYSDEFAADVDFDEGLSRLNDKIAFIKRETKDEAFIFSDFGTRRRFSKKWQQQVDGVLAKELPQNFIGCSNVLFAKQYHVKPIGTMAHEYLQACQSLGPRLVLSQKFAFERWAQEYRGDLGIALSDVYTIDAFLRDFDLFFCKLFDGARQDSGDPFVWGERVIAHYQAMNINPKTKTLVFSDGLTVPLAVKIFHHFKDRANPVFGIGTNLMNDLGNKRLDIVIKMVECNGQPVAKVSDEPGKSMCKDASYLNYLKKVFKI